MIELLIVILIVFAVLAFVLPATGHPFPGGNIVAIALVILLVVVLVSALSGFECC